MSITYIPDFGDYSFCQDTGLSVYNDINTLDANITSINNELVLVNSNIAINQANINSNVYFLDGSRPLRANMHANYYNIDNVGTFRGNVGNIVNINGTLINSTTANINYLNVSINGNIENAYIDTATIDGMTVDSAIITEAIITGAVIQTGNVVNLTSSSAQITNGNITGSLINGGTYGSFVYDIQAYYDALPFPSANTIEVYKSVIACNFSTNQTINTINFSTLWSGPEGRFGSIFILCNNTQSSKTITVNSGSTIYLGETISSIVLPFNGKIMFLYSSTSAKWCLISTNYDHILSSATVISSTIINSSLQTLGTQAENLDMGTSYKITNLAVGSSNTDSLRYDQVLFNSSTLSTGILNSSIQSLGTQNESLYMGDFAIYDCQFIRGSSFLQINFNNDNISGCDVISTTNTMIIRPAQTLYFYGTNLDQRCGVYQGVNPPINNSAGTIILRFGEVNGYFSLRNNSDTEWINVDNNAINLYRPLYMNNSSITEITSLEVGTATISTSLINQGLYRSMVLDRTAWYVPDNVLYTTLTVSKSLNIFNFTTDKVIDTIVFGAWDGTTGRVGSITTCLNTTQTPAALITFTASSSIYLGKTAADVAISSIILRRGDSATFIYEPDLAKWCLMHTTVDTSGGVYLPLTGGTLSGDLSLGSNDINGVTSINGLGGLSILTIKNTASGTIYIDSDISVHTYVAGSEKLRINTTNMTLYTGLSLNQNTITNSGNITFNSTDSISYINGGTAKSLSIETNGGGHLYLDTTSITSYIYLKNNGDTMATVGSLGLTVQACKSITGTVGTPLTISAYPGQTFNIEASGASNLILYTLGTGQLILSGAKNGSGAVEITAPSASGTVTINAGSNLVSTFSSSTLTMNKPIALGNNNISNVNEFDCNVAVVDGLHCRYVNTTFSGTTMTISGTTNSFNETSNYTINTISKSGSYVPNTNKNFGDICILIVNNQHGKTITIDGTGGNIATVSGGSHTLPVNEAVIFVFNNTQDKWILTARTI